MDNTGRAEGGKNAYVGGQTGTIRENHVGEKYPHALGLKSADNTSHWKIRKHQ